MARHSATPTAVRAVTQRPYTTCSSGATDRTGTAFAMPQRSGTTTPAPPSQVRLGSDIPAGERPQHVVPANWWQSAASLGDWTLVGCTVAPGFDFTVFEMAPPEWQPPDAHKGAQVNG